MFAVLAVFAATAYVCAALARSRVGVCFWPWRLISNPAAGPSPPFSAHYGAFRNGTTVSEGGATMLRMRCAHSAKASCSSAS